MKKIVLITIALLAIQVSAQERKERPNRERDVRMERLQELTPEEMATLQTKKMKLHLDLTESQQREIQKINLENAKKRKAKMEEHKTQKESGSFERPSKEERLKMMNEHLDHQIEIKAKMKTILNAEQYAKWEKSLNYKEKRHHKEGKPNPENRKR